MVKKISFLLLAAAILVTGYFAFNKLNYWERSVRIFSIKKQDQIFERRGGRDGFERPAMRELPDSIRSRFGEEGGGPIMRDRNIPDSIRARIATEGGRQMTRNRNTPDSLRQQGGRNDRELSGRGPFERGMRNGQGRGRGEFPGGRKIYLRNVLWFLAVFSSFTVIVIYLDKAYCLALKSKKQLKGHISKSPDGNEQ